MVLHQDVTSCYIDDMAEAYQNESFMDDLRTIVVRTEKLEFDRNWTIYAARVQEGEKIKDIAEAVQLSRMQVSRILNELTAITDEILASNPELDLQDVFDHAWSSKGWEFFRSHPVRVGARDDEEKYIEGDKS